MIWPNQSTKSMNAFYGNPDINGDGTCDVKFELEHIVRFEPPYPMVLAWDTKRKVSKIAVNAKCAPSLYRILEQIGKTLTPETIEKYHLNRYGGCFNFRMVRGSTARLSTHSWGAAIDLAPDLNPLGKQWDGKLMMPLSVVQIFKNEGWVWGGLWQRPDAQHFQAANI